MSELTITKEIREQIRYCAGFYECAGDRCKYFNNKHDCIEINHNAIPLLDALEATEAKLEAVTKERDEAVADRDCLAVVIYDYDTNPPCVSLDWPCPDMQCDHYGEAEPCDKGLSPDCYIRYAAAQRGQND